jgi:hypothetical protein
MQTLIGICQLPNFVAQGPIMTLVDVNVQERQVDAVSVVEKKIVKLLWTVWPDDKGIFSIPNPAAKF